MHSALEGFPKRLLVKYANSESRDNILESGDGHPAIHVQL